MITTVTLSRGAVRMAARKVVVKRLASIHDLGAMTVLCTDKTGTLTQARIELVGHPGIDGADSRRVLELAAVNSGFESKMRSSLDDAILAGAHDLPLEGWRGVADVPFDYERRRVSVLAEHAAQRLLIVKGAPEDIIALSIAVERADGTVHPLDAAGRAELAKLYQDKTDQGFRCIAVGWRDFPRRRRSPERRGRSGAGVRRASAYSSIHPSHRPRRRSSGWKPPVSGSRSYPAMPRRPCSIWSRRLTCRRVDCCWGPTLPASALPRSRVQAQKTDLFARVSPDQKTRIIRALQAGGHTVGFIGDGINDAPATARRRCRTRGRRRHRRRARRRRHDHARTRSRRGRRRRRGGPPHLCEHHEISAHGNVVEFRQHAVDGGRLAVHSVPAADADPGSAQQPALRSERSGNSLRHRDAARHPAAARLGNVRTAALHADHGAAVVAVRYRDLR